MKWAVYYDDGSRVTDENPIGEVPPRGVIAIAQEDSTVGRIVVTKKDYYWFESNNGDWYGGDLFGLWDYLCRPGMKRVLFGRSIPRDEYEAIVHEATHDDYLPQKTARDGYREADA